MQNDTSPRPGIDFNFLVCIRTKNKKKVTSIFRSVEMLEDLINSCEMRQHKNRLGGSHDVNPWQSHIVNMKHKQVIFWLLYEDYLRQLIMCEWGRAIALEVASQGSLPCKPSHNLSPNVCSYL
jgi:hypothetical protein